MNIVVLKKYIMNSFNTTNSTDSVDVVGIFSRGEAVYNMYNNFILFMICFTILGVLVIFFLKCVQERKYWMATCFAKDNSESTSGNDLAMESSNSSTARTARTAGTWEMTA